MSRKPRVIGRYLLSTIVIGLVAIVAIVLLPNAWAEPALGGAVALASFVSGVSWALSADKELQADSIRYNRTAAVAAAAAGILAAIYAGAHTGGAFLDHRAAAAQSVRAQ